MFEWLTKWLKRQSLINKGLSCDRSRRQVYSSELSFFVDCSPVVRVAALVLAIVAVIRIGMWNSAMGSYETAVLSALIFGAGILLMPLIVRELWDSNRLLILTLVCFIINLFINKSIFVLLDQPTVFSSYITTDVLVPSALGPMLVTILISPYAGVFLVFLLSVADHAFLNSNIQVLTSSLLTGLAGVFFTRNIRRRTNLLSAGVAVGLVGLACTVIHGGMADPSLLALLVHGVWAIALGVATAFVVGAVLPILEWMFDRITNISWLELTDLNHPLLRKLSMEAPGTFHHSLGTANLAEAAATAIPGSNPTMCRVLAYFHDIGKLTKPSYFIENTTVDANPHNDISPSMSALIIISHVKEGVDRAIKHGLPKPVIDVIQQHHGTTLVYYFYRKAIQQQEDARQGSEILKMPKSDTPEVEESSFRYPGPVPKFKESGIVSLADAIESTARNLAHPTPQSIETLVDDIIKKRVDEGQLEQSQLTLQEIRTAADRFTFTLKNMLHARIEYPKETAREDREKDRKFEKKNGKERPADSANAQRPAKALPLVSFPTEKTK